MEPMLYREMTPKARRIMRNEYVEEQGGMCFFCGEPLADPPPDHVHKKKLNMKLFPPNFLSHPVHLQHDHVSGLTEGAVHAYCNGVWWQYNGR